MLVESRGGAAFQSGNFSACGRHCRCEDTSAEGLSGALRCHRLGQLFRGGLFSDVRGLRGPRVARLQLERGRASEFLGLRRSRNSRLPFCAQCGRKSTGPWEINRIFSAHIFGNGKFILDVRVRFGGMGIRGQNAAALEIENDRSWEEPLCPVLRGGERRVPGSWNQQMEIRHSTMMHRKFLEICWKFPPRPKSICASPRGIRRTHR